MNRRDFAKNSFLALTGIGLTTGVYVNQIEPFWLEFVERPLSIKNLPKNLVGKTLMQISDTHVGKRFDWNYLIESFAKAKAYDPDIVVYTGDFVDYRTGDQLQDLRTVMKHAVTGRLGTYGVLGNHDYGEGWSQLDVASNVVDILDQSGINILRNDVAYTNGMQILGIDDYWSPNFDPARAMKHSDNDQAQLALCHNPDACDQDVWNGYQGWIFSGHTHGGQCKPPFLPAPRLPVKNKKYSQGHIDLEDGRHLYINRALGHLWQVRFNVRPEITVFTLERKEA